MKPLNLLVLVALFSLLVMTAGHIVADPCNGYCQTSGSCPSPGYNCGTGVCCYCCFTCQDSYCHVWYGACYLPDGSPGDFIAFYQEAWYKCFAGSDCHFTQYSVKLNFAFSEKAIQSQNASNRLQYPG
jgi:hypothetical protein